MSLSRVSFKASAISDNPKGDLANSLNSYSSSHLTKISGLDKLFTEIRFYEVQ
jgi:hypothetical protein